MALKNEANEQLINQLGHDQNWIRKEEYFMKMEEFKKREYELREQLTRNLNTISIYEDNFKKKESMTDSNKMGDKDSIISDNFIILNTDFDFIFKEILYLN